MDRAVEQAVEGADQAVDHPVDHAVNQAAEQAMDRAADQAVEQGVEEADRAVDQTADKEDSCEWVIDLVTGGDREQHCILWEGHCAHQDWWQRLPGKFVFDSNVYVGREIELASRLALIGAVFDNVADVLFADGSKARLNMLANRMVTGKSVAWRLTHCAVEDPPEIINDSSVDFAVSAEAQGARRQWLAHKGRLYPTVSEARFIIQAAAETMDCELLDRQLQLAVAFLSSPTRAELLDFRALVQSMLPHLQVGSVLHDACRVLGGIHESEVGSL